MTMAIVLTGCIGFITTLGITMVSGVFYMTKVEDKTNLDSKGRNHTHSNTKMKEVA